jgi:hypothetical protein
MLAVGSALKFEQDLELVVMAMLFARVAVCLQPAPSCYSALIYSYKRTEPASLQGSA